MATVVCEHCGSDFRVAPSHVRNSVNGSRRRFCSRPCRYAAMRGAYAPNSGKGNKIKGENNPRWRGGVSAEIRGRLPFMAEWQQWRRRVFHRDGYTCRRCGISPKTGRQLRGHHIASWAGHPDKRFDLDNGITLCRSCHDWVHSSLNVHRDYLA